MAHKLPTELIEHIFTCVDETDKGAVAAICRTNRLGHKIATPLLYRHISFDNDNMDPLERSYRLQCLCEAFVINPTLTRYVEKIHLTLDRRFSEQKQTPFDFRSRWTSLIRNDMDVALWVRLLISSELEVDATTISDEMCSTLLLMTCDRLQKLQFSGDLHAFKKMEIFTEALNALGISAHFAEAQSFSPSTWGNTGLHSVRQVELRHTSESSLLVTKDILPLLHLPSLESLSTNVLTSAMNGVVERDSFAPSSPVQNLAIEGCDASWHDLEYLIKCCKNLRSLRLERTDYNNSSLRYEWEDVRQALRAFVPNIEDVRLEGPDGVSAEGLGDVNEKHYPVLEYLCEKKPLKTLACSGLSLFSTPGYHWTLKDTVSCKFTVKKEEQKADFVLSAVPIAA